MRSMPRAGRRRVQETGAIVLASWRLEVANSSTLAVRRGRIDVEFRRAALADDARLTVYDAAYLELARRRNLPLAMLDRQMCAAAMTLGVSLPGTG